uniref:Uncharacterized protein n=1 Tax=Setaria italica TaxID=4555 RepID=K4ANG1_SETIT
MHNRHIHSICMAACKLTVIAVNFFFFTFTSLKFKGPDLFNILPPRR